MTTRRLRVGAREYTLHEGAPPPPTAAQLAQLEAWERDVRAAAQAQKVARAGASGPAQSEARRRELGHPMALTTRVPAEVRAAVEAAADAAGVTVSAWIAEAIRARLAG